MKVKLPNVTLCIVDCYNYGEAISALKRSLAQIEPAKAIFLTDIKASNPNFPFEIIKIDKISNKAEYSAFILKELNKYIETDYVLIIQHDGYILDGNAWDEKFLEYDYIGASWLETDGYNVGNGGFSLRSKKLQHILATDDFIKPIHSAEDVMICRLYRPYLEEKYGIKFAPEEIADKFSYELREPVQPTFGFHGKFHEPYKKTMVVMRSAALGDCIAIEPLLEYYHNKGYRVVIDMPLHFALVYAVHYFNVMHISQITDKRIPLTVIDLDGSYEAKPKQLHLQSYYETAGITDGVIRNPKLHFPIGDHNRLFKNYVVLHIDNRDQKYRNVYGVDFIEVVRELNNKGYNVVQVGLTDHEDVYGAIQFNTPTTNLLLCLISGASGFVGVDSGPAAMAVACNKPSVIFFGSVDAKVIHPDLSNVEVVEYAKVCDTPKCWGDVENGTTGKECVVDKEAPPCTQFTTKMAIDAINKRL